MQIRDKTILNTSSTLWVTCYALRERVETALLHILTTEFSAIFLLNKNRKLVHSAVSEIKLARAIGHRVDEER